MTSIEVLSPWGTTADGYHCPQLAIDYPVLRMEDVTGQDASSLPPAVNLVIVEATVDDKTFASLSADPKYLVLSTDRNALFESDERDRLSSYLASRGVDAGTVQQIDGLASRNETTAALKSHLRKLPKSLGASAR